MTGHQFFRDRVDEAARPGRSSGASEMLAVAMADVEPVLVACATALGVAIRYGCEVDALEQLTDGVVVHAGGERLGAEWLVGCDGGRSAVREVLREGRAVLLDLDPAEPLSAALRLELAGNS
ncbi:hypothetical protein EAH79_01890 [Sphingomonas koreensis]|nr:hypothetical protein EAH79_01890 [Sphingomonas koreensis]